MDWEDHSNTYIRSRSYSKTTATMDFGDSRDSGFGGSRDADETFHGTAPTTPTDFSSLVENCEKHGPTTNNESDTWPFQRSPPSALESETQLVLATKVGFSTTTPFWDAPPPALTRKTVQTPVYSRQISAPVCSKGRPLPFKDITNTPKHVGVSSKSLKKAPLAQLPIVHVKASRKRTLTLENEAKKRRTSNELMFTHGNDRTIPAPARSLLRVHSSSLLESSASREHAANQSSPDPLEHYSLRTLDRPQIAHGAFRSISAATLCQLLGSMTGEQFLKKFFLVDCRYPYEYNGGHIRHAVNIFDPSKIGDVFYPTEDEKFLEMNAKIPIFYCEFSQKRGPCMALELRRLDRARNEGQYPFVNYKEIYLLDQGYKQFYDDKHIEFCEPRNYIPMFHANHQADLKLYRYHKRSVYGTEQRASQRYFNGRKVSNATLRKQMSLRAGAIRSHSLSSDWDDSLTPCSSGILNLEQDSVQSSGYLVLSDSPVSSTSASAAGSSAKQLPPLQQRLSRLTMQSPSSQSFGHPVHEIICESSLIFQSRRSLFASICEESCSSSSSSVSTSPQPDQSTMPLPKPRF
ncbi:rhodanese-like domain-containing protein [Ditylenchus destructor]|uniref:protein-tyrosine-phosphatase n=1 Tax=Ditylenchus destructor TaxID=166010 RepID=A0AAD4NC13_9BILA|nr:rhodanese-like domain-containing protein [Ditylenchus destructor]